MLVVFLRITRLLQEKEIPVFNLCFIIEFTFEIHTYVYFIFPLILVVIKKIYLGKIMAIRTHPVLPHVGKPRELAPIYYHILQWLINNQVHVIFGSK